MKLHREGYLIIIIAMMLLSAIQVGNFYLLQFTGWLWLFWILTFGAVLMAYLVVQFFRVPNIQCVFGENDIMSPADGKVVVIEETAVIVAVVVVIITAYMHVLYVCTVHG